MNIPSNKNDKDDKDDKNDNETITTTEWCVIKTKYSDMYLCKKSGLYKDELKLLVKTADVLKNPKAVLPNTWIIPVALC